MYMCRYAMERTHHMINMWFWARNDPTVPREVSDPRGAGVLNPATWGTPYANFVDDHCAISSFQPQNIIINLTLCESQSSKPA